MAFTNEEAMVISEIVAQLKAMKADTTRLEKLLALTLSESKLSPKEKQKIELSIVV